MNNINKRKLSKKKGFTLIELLVVISMIIVFVLFITTAVNSARNKSYTASALQEFRAFQFGMTAYLIDNGNYPADVDRNIPSGMESYLSGGNWPDGPYPGSVYDWDNITGADPYIQISLRFCDQDGSNCNFPTELWAYDFDSNSSMYWCFEGDCRAHPARPVDHPGYCVNC